MLKIANYKVSEADSIYGEFVEKTAFDASVVIPALVGSITGGITSNKLMNKKTEGIIRSEQRGKLDNNFYSDIGNLLNDLKVTFTPINTIFTVSGQTFEIISVSEMNDEMQAAHRRRDGDYFVKLLINKMNMELQMAERYFARQLLTPHLSKEAKKLNLEILHEDLDKEENVSKLEGSLNIDQSITIPVDLESLRPFNQNEGFFDVEKVASTKVSFEELGVPNIEKNVKVNFLPDRVLYIHNGTLLEQLSVMGMNEEGYQAFKNKDKDFFKSFFVNFVNEFNPLNKEASLDEGDDFTFKLNHEFGNEEFYKTAATLEERSNREDWVELLAFDKEFINIFLDHDTHPIVYDLFLDKEYGSDWHTQEIESILKRIEVDFLNNEAIPDPVFNKLLLLHTIQSPDNSILLAAFSFEKFIRGLNGKTVHVTEIEGNLEFDEILFALDIAESICDYNIYMDLSDSVAAYVSSQLLEDNIRYVSKSIYHDEENEFKNDFWSTVNGFLVRKWKDKDSHSLYGDESSASRDITVFITEAIDKILESNAELLDFERPYESSRIVTKAYFKNSLDRFEEKEGIIEAISSNITRHLLNVMFSELKRQEAEFILDKMLEEVKEG